MSSRNPIPNQAGPYGGNAQRTQVNLDWGQYAYDTTGVPNIFAGRSTDTGGQLLPNASPASALPAGFFEKLEAGDTATTMEPPPGETIGTNYGKWVCIDPGTAGGGDAVWIRMDNLPSAAAIQNTRDAHLIVVGIQPPPLPGPVPFPTFQNAALQTIFPETIGDTCDFIDGGNGAGIQTALSLAQTIQAALATALVPVGVDVRVRPGTVNMDGVGAPAVLSISNDTRLIGAGSRQTRIIGRSTGDQAAFLVNSRARLEGFRIESPAPTAGTVASAQNAVVQCDADVTLDDLALSYATAASPNNRSLFVMLSVESGAQIGDIRFDGASEAELVTGNRSIGLSINGAGLDTPVEIDSLRFSTGFDINVTSTADTTVQCDRIGGFAHMIGLRIVGAAPLDIDRVSQFGEINFTMEATTSVALATEERAGIAFTSRASEATNARVLGVQIGVAQISYQTAVGAPAGTEPWYTVLVDCLGISGNSRRIRDVSIANLRGRRWGTHAILIRSSLLGAAVERIAFGVVELSDDVPTSTDFAVQVTTANVRQVTFQVLRLNSAGGQGVNFQGFDHEIKGGAINAADHALQLGSPTSPGAFAQRCRVSGTALIISSLAAGASAVRIGGPGASSPAIACDVSHNNIEAPAAAGTGVLFEATALGTANNSVADNRITAAPALHVIDPFATNQVHDNILI